MLDFGMIEDKIFLCEEIIVRFDKIEEKISVFSELW